MLDQQEIEQIAQDVIQWPSKRKWNTTEKDRRFRALFGAPSDLVAVIWNRIEPMIDEPGANPKHLLWALVFLKAYSTEAIHCAIVGWPSEKTFRKWSWYFIRKISELKDDVIRLDNRYTNGPDADSAGLKCYLTVDCTDCPINEPFPFDRKNWSKKINGPALKYEVAICIQTGYIVWINGPFRASVPDRNIFNQGLSNELGDDEIVEADSSYSNCPKARLPDQGFTSAERKKKSVVRGRHEAVNARLKNFNILAAYFRHMKPNMAMMMEKHGWCFAAVAVITQMKFENGESCFDIDNYDVGYV